MLGLCWKFQSLSSPSPCAEKPRDVNLILHFINIKSEIVNKANSATKSYQNKNIFTPIALMHNNLHLWIYNENIYIFRICTAKRWLWVDEGSLTLRSTFADYSDLQFVNSSLTKLELFANDCETEQFKSILLLDISIWYYTENMKLDRIMIMFSAAHPRLMRSPIYVIFLTREYSEPLMLTLQEQG